MDYDDLIDVDTIKAFISFLSEQESHQTVYNLTSRLRIAMEEGPRCRFFPKIIELNKHLSNQKRDKNEL